MNKLLKYRTGGKAVAHHYTGILSYGAYEAAFARTRDAHYGDYHLFRINGFLTHAE
jgi:hypothetical protein